MKSTMTALLLFLFTIGVSAQTLGEATEQVRSRVESMISAHPPQNISWGEQTALDDLRQVQQAATSLLEALNGNDAEAVKQPQQQLTSAARRLKASSSLLPETAERSDELLDQVMSIDAKLSELRLRFGQKASLTPTPLFEQPLETHDSAFALYENPQALLIDIRDARRLASQLEVGGYRDWTFGYGQPNNLDALQVRRLVLAARDLERALESNFSDISEVQAPWEKLRKEYDRLGYPGNTLVTRQLDKVMQRLTAFFQGALIP